MPACSQAEGFVVPDSPDTVGHGTAAQARHWKARLVEVMNGTPRRAGP